MAADLGPGENDLGGGGVELGGDLLDDVVLDEEGKTEAVVAKGLRVLVTGSQRRDMMLGFNIQSRR